MTVGEGITRIDLWILDRVFQPLADRLPERLPAFEVGMSLLFGSLMLSGAATAAMIFLLGMDPFSAMFDILIWVLWVSFYLGVNRVRSLVRPGFVNPLRAMFLGLRPISLVFLIYSAWQGSTVDAHYALATWFNTLANATFTIGVYLASCNVKPPEQQASVWQRDFVGAPD
ncbi:hypothetical protein LWC05_06035 [Acetobacter sicerae]|uniref:Uncharacterized protein n=1 Tax=Acetobacter sicerae TaxID=85325 RepID=A0ABS8VY90_9PROT|nr:hypothetical protein [Acetobacter sicerae]MCE0743451.1 hypothetical protein [Acetobacter sicerae]NHN91723.1 hypothetical protein [Acetobacter sicerae]